MTKSHSLTQNTMKVFYVLVACRRPRRRHRRRLRLRRCRLRHRCCCFTLSVA